jgi:hypothetical protein
MTLGNNGTYNGICEGRPEDRICDPNITPVKGQRKLYDNLFELQALLFISAVVE